jgi:hypothetical protein
MTEKRQSDALLQTHTCRTERERERERERAREREKERVREREREREINISLTGLDSLVGTRPKEFGCRPLGNELVSKWTLAESALDLEYLNDRSQMPDAAVIGRLPKT